MKKKRSSIRAVHMDNLSGVLRIRRMDRVTNARIKKFCGVSWRIDERIDEMMKVSSGGSAMWREWRIIRVRRKSIEESVQVVVQWVG